MQIFLKKSSDNKVIALDVEGCSLTIITPYVWCDNDDLSTEYEHVEGVYWKDLDDALSRLNLTGEHDILVDLATCGKVEETVNIRNV